MKLLFLALLLAGCTDPQCLESHVQKEFIKKHDELQYVYGYNFMNGKFENHLENVEVPDHFADKIVCDLFETPDQVEARAARQAREFKETAWAAGKFLTKVLGLGLALLGVCLLLKYRRRITWWVRCRLHPDKTKKDSDMGGPFR